MVKVNKQVAPLGSWGGEPLVLPNYSGVKKHLAERAEWDDAQVALGSVGFGSSAPNWTAYKGSEVLAFNKAQDNKIFFICQLPHSYKLESNIEFHLHLVHPDGGAGTSRWCFTYTWAALGEAFADETTLYKNFSNSGADTHQYGEFVANIDGTGKGISSVLLCSLTRQGTDLSDEYDNDVYMIALDFHIEKDSMGSRFETSKS